MLENDHESDCEVDFADDDDNDVDIAQINAISENVKMHFITCRPNDKIAALLFLCRWAVRTKQQTIVFCATMKHVEYITSICKEAELDCSFLYSQLDPTARKINIARFRNQECYLLVVTDIAARGVDIPLLDVAINFHFSPTAKLFVHRVGRVARAGRAGMSFSLITPDELPYTADLFLFLNKPLKFLEEGIDRKSIDTRESLLGRFPENLVHLETEFLKSKDISTDITDLNRQSEISMKKYERIRPQPSAESIQRANKEFQNVTLAIHPFFDDFLENNIADQHLVLEGLPNAVDTIYENFTGFFEVPERCVAFLPFTSESSVFDGGDECGFPEVLDLSDYWTSEKREPEKDAVEGKQSLFALAFDEAKSHGVKKLSFFKKSRQKAVIEQSVSPDVLPEIGTKEMDIGKAALEEEFIKRLEVIENLSDPKNQEYSRLAMDSVNLDFATKVMRTTVPRQEANVLRLFDKLKTGPKKTAGKCSKLCEMARSKIDEIKALFLEEIEVEKGKTVWRFAADVNPIVNGAWCFVPIRRVLDAVQNRAEGGSSLITDDDVEIIQLSLLWSVLLLAERPTFFHVLSQPNDVYCRMAEIYLIGPELFSNEIVSRCVRTLINGFLYEKGQRNLLVFRLTASIASLDAFMPFFEDLLGRFEEYSCGDENFALFILIAIYMNAAVGDSLMLVQAVWAPGRNVVRQMTVSKKCVATAPLLETVKEWRNRHIIEVEEQHFQSYSRLLAMYAAAIRDELVTMQRNPIVFEIAATELGEFVRRHTRRGKDNNLSEECMKEFDILTDIIRKTVSNKLTL